MPGPAPKPQFPLIDVLRGFAAISVMVAHAIGVFDWQTFPRTGPWAWFRVGWLGLDLFFVISGFVISLSAFTSLDVAPRGFRRTFLSHRLRRIVPLYVLTGACFIIFVEPAWLAAPDLWKNIGVHLAFIHNFWPVLSRSIDSPNWSVGVEMQFYLIVLLAASFLRRVDWRILLVGSLVIAWSWRFGAYLLIDPQAPMGLFRLEVAAHQLPGMFDDFALGIVLARLVRSRSASRVLRPGWVGRVLPTLIAALVIWLMLAVFYAVPDYWRTPLMVTGFGTLAGLAAATVIVAAISLESPAAVLIATPLRYLGRVSYGLYLWHMPVLLSVHRIPGVPAREAMLIAGVATLLLSAWSWHFFERPILRRSYRLPA